MAIFGCTFFKQKLILGFLLFVNKVVQLFSTQVNTIQAKLDWGRPYSGKIASDFFLL